MKVRIDIDAPDHDASDFRNTGDFLTIALDAVRKVRQQLPIGDNVSLDQLVIGNVLDVTLDDLVATVAHTDDVEPDDSE